MPFDPSLLGPFFRYNDGFGQGGANAVQIVPPNPYRIVLILGTGAGTQTIRFSQAPAPNLGFALVTGQAPQIYTFGQHGALVQQSVWVAAGGGVVYFQEVLYVPPSD